jgi:predicted nucleotidyltransferase
MIATETILETIKSTVRGHIPDAEVSLFGSRARNTADPDSDYDILVITNKELSPKEKIPLKTAIRKDLLKSDIRTDILIQSSKEIRKKKLLPGHIIKNILKESILL